MPEGAQVGSASPHGHKELQLGQRAARMGAEGPFSKQNVANVGTAKVVQVLGEFAGESPGLALSSNDAEHRRAFGEAPSGTSGTGDALFRGISVTWDGETPRRC